MNDDWSGTKLPTSVELVGGWAEVELVGGTVDDVSVLLLDCASAATVKDKLANSKTRINHFLEDNKFALFMLNTHNLYGSY